MLYKFLTTFLQDNTFIEILEIVKENLNGPRNDAYLTAIVALGHIAYLMPEKYPVQIKNVVARNIVKQLLMKEVTEVCRPLYYYSPKKIWVQTENPIS